MGSVAWWNALFRGEEEGVNMEEYHVLADEELTVKMDEDGVLWVKGPNGKSVKIIAIEDGLAIYP